MDGFAIGDTEGRPKSSIYTIYIYIGLLILGVDFGRATRGGGGRNDNDAESELVSGSVDDLGPWFQSSTSVKKSDYM